jgi:hypothetical protein
VASVGWLYLDGFSKVAFSRWSLSGVFGRVAFSLVAFGRGLSNVALVR